MHKVRLMVLYKEEKEKERSEWMKNKGSHQANRKRLMQMNNVKVKSVLEQKVGFCSGISLVQ